VRWWRTSPLTDWKRSRATITQLPLTAGTRRAATGGGDGEIAFSVADRAAVDATHADWKERGLPILQSPTEMDFGRTFVAGDPDGHRLRVFFPVAP